MGFISGEEKEGFFFFLIDAILSGVGNSRVYCGGKKKKGEMESTYRSRYGI